MLTARGLSPRTSAEPYSSGNFSAECFEVAGPMLIKTKKFGDHRGFFVEEYSQKDFSNLGISDNFVQDNHSLSELAGTIRGLHFQIKPRAQAKLVRVLRGRILDIAVDLRGSSSTFGLHVAVELSAENGCQFYVPIGFAHGFCTLEENTEVYYKVTDFYAPECDRGLAWDDTALNLSWPIGPGGAHLSDKDLRQPRLADLPPLFD